MSKGDLQEYYQKVLKLPPPIYISKIVGGEDHTPLWKSSLKYEGCTYVGETYQTKVAAESSVADKVLKKIKGEKNQQKITTLRKDETPDFRKSASETKSFHDYETISDKIENLHLSKRVNFSFNEDIVLMVDSENLPNLVVELFQKIEPNDRLNVLLFVGEHHHLASKVPGEDILGVKKIITPSSRKDANDTNIQMCVGAFLVDQTYEKYMIATKDHFGGSIVDIIEKPSKYWSTRKAFHVSHVDHVLKVLEDLKK